jgi:hypothetical protein
MGLYLQDRKIGYSHARFAPQGDGFWFEQTSLLRLNVMDTTQLVHVLVRGQAGPDYALRTFEASLNSGVGRFAAEGRVEGEALVVRMRMGDEENEQRFPLREPIYLPTGAREYFARDQLAAGRQWSVTAFDPAAMQRQTMTVTVEDRERLTLRGRSVDTWRVREEFRGIKTLVWFDDEGAVVREEGPLNLVALRETESEAVREGWAGDTALDVMAAVAVPVRGAIAAPRTLRRLVVRLGGIADVPVPTDARQRTVDGRVVIEREDGAAAGTFTLPYRDEPWRAELAATPFLQVDHPRVVAAAREALGGERDARGAAERLRRWVFDRLAKRPTVSLPNAVQVLDMDGGDCNEHAVLFAALARAAGLPARVVAGAVFMNDTFLYHAWNEVWLGQSWVSVDPTFDQMPADATHLKLVTGGPEAHDELLRVIGRLSVDVVAAR